MKQLSIIERVREQEELARKFHEVEVRLLSLLDYGDFFSTLPAEISQTFDISLAWFTLRRETETASLLQQCSPGRDLRRAVRLVETETFFRLGPSSEAPLLINENLMPYYRLFPEGERPLVRSLALAPVFVDGETVGSLNLGDPSAERFRPGYRTDFLERLAVKVSLCLSNVTAHEKLKMIAHRDPLTNLHNRRIMETILAREAARAHRYGSPLSLVFLDLDDFKRVNDTHGHDCGDRLLQYVAETLLRTCRHSDLVTRFAGDEFVLILPETLPETAEQLMQRIQLSLDRRPFAAPGVQVPVTLSYGIASRHELEGDDPGALLKLADERLYRFKRSRKKKQGNGR